MVSKERQFYKQIIWFDNRKKFEIDFFDLLQPQRIVSEDPRYRSGKFYSDKCGREIQYESGIELNFIRQLETLKNVVFYYEQPVQIKYRRGRRKQTYTPDFGILLDTNEFVIVEIKDLTGMLEEKVQSKIEGLMEFCSNKGFGLLFTDGKHSIEKLHKVKCNRMFEQELLRAVDGGVLRKKDCTELMKKCRATQNQLLKAILKHDLRYKSYPLKLQRGNRNEIFRKVFVEKKRYDDLFEEKYPTLFGKG